MSNKHTILATAAVALTLFTATIGTAKGRNNGVMTHQADGTYIVNTTTLCANVKGFGGPTRLQVYIKNNKVVKVEPLDNHETPKFFARVKSALLGQWHGMTVKKAATTDVDGVSGATYSSRAVKANVKAAVKYYQKYK